MTRVTIALAGVKVARWHLAPSADVRLCNLHTLLPTAAGPNTATCRRVGRRARAEKIQTERLPLFRFFVTAFKFFFRPGRATFLKISVR